MTRAQSDSGVAIEVLVKKDQIAPVWVLLMSYRRAGCRARPIGTSQEQAREAVRQFRRNLPQREHLTGPGRALYFQSVAVIVVVPLQRLDDEVVDRKPHRTSPVRVPAERSAL